MQINFQQAKRKKHLERSNERTYQMHAAQIYAETLGQVCHKACYHNEKGFQEVDLSLTQI